MTQTLKAITAATTLAFVAACSSGSSSGGSNIDPIEIGDVNTAIADAVTLFDNNAENIGDPLSVNELVALGSASYEGFAFFAPSDTFNNLIGRTQIEADFTNGGSLTGEINNIIQIDEANAQDVIDSETGELILADAPLFNVDGTLALSNGNIQEFSTFGEIDIDVNGDLTLPGALTQSQEDEIIAVDGSITAAIVDDRLVAVGFLDTDSDELSLETIIIAD